MSRTKKLNCCFDLKLIRIHTVINPAKMPVAERGTKTNCNKNGTMEKMATPINIDKGMQTAGLRRILTNDKTPKPMQNCKMVNKAMIKIEVIGSPGIF